MTANILINDDFISMIAKSLLNLLLNIFAANVFRPKRSMIKIFIMFFELFTVFNWVFELVVLLEPICIRCEVLFNRCLIGSYYVFDKF